MNGLRKRDDSRDFSNRTTDSGSNSNSGLAKTTHAKPLDPRPSTPRIKPPPSSLAAANPVKPKASLVYHSGHCTCIAVKPLFGADAQKDILGTLTEHGVEKAQERLLFFYPDALDSGEADDVEECQMQE